MLGGGRASDPERAWRNGVWMFRRYGTYVCRYTCWVAGGPQIQKEPGAMEGMPLGITAHMYIYIHVGYIYINAGWRSRTSLMQGAERAFRFYTYISIHRQMDG